jgi:mRNA-degrading endonuclease RelE of RelBE toxin-antitoxin system
MNFNIFPTLKFEKELKRLVKKFPSLKNEYRQLLDDILQNPEAGTLIAENCYKIRLAINSKGKGKRGGARVITYLYFETKTVYLLTIYDKSEKEDLKPNELKNMIESLDLDI